MASLLWRGLAVLSLLSVLACTTPSQQGRPLLPSEFYREGRFALQVRNTQLDKTTQQVAGGFQWLQRDDYTQLVLRSPFGQVLAVLHVLPELTRLQLASGEHRSTDPDRLLQAALGQPLPMRALQYWVHGKVYPAWPSTQAQYDDAGRLIAVVQGGWHLQWRQFDAQGPTHLVLSQQKAAQSVVLRLVGR